MTARGAMGGRSNRDEPGRDEPGADRSGSRAGLSEHDRRRLRVTYRTALAGLVLGILGAAAIGMIGASGRAGAAVLLVIGSAGCLAAALVTAVLAMVDEYRHIAVGRPRTLAALWFFLGAALLLVMSTGVGSA